ncbi:hypothetical protein FRC06_008548, partial [Ceratobasidium sp. 370]
MFVPLLPLLMLATGLLESALNCLNYYNVADLANRTSRLFAVGSVSQALLGTVAVVEFPVEGRDEPLCLSLIANIWSHLRLENVPVSALFYSSSVTPLGPYELAVNSPYLGLLPGGPEPSRPASAVAPIRGYTNRISTSATSPPAPLPTPLAGRTPLVDGHAPDGDGLSPDRLTIDHAPTVPRPMAAPLPVSVPDSGEGVLSVLPAKSDGELLSGPPAVITIEPTVLDSAVSESVLDSRASWAPQYTWILVWILPLLVHFGVGFGLYQASAKEAEMPKTPRLPEELGDLPSIIDEHGISLDEPRESIEFIVRGRRSV